MTKDNTRPAASEATKRRPGRPRGSSKPGKAVRITFTAPQPIAAWLRERSKERGRSVSATISAMLSALRDVDK